MTNLNKDIKTYPLSVDVGIQKDNTPFVSRAWIDGHWVRFQDGLPRSIGGYASLVNLSDNTYTAGLLPMIPRASYITPSLSTNNQWLLIVGFCPQAINAGFTPTITNIIGLCTIDANTVSIVGSLIPIGPVAPNPPMDPLPSPNPFIVPDAAVTSYVFESMAAAIVMTPNAAATQSIFLFSVQTSTLGSIGASASGPYPVMYMNLDQDFNNVQPVQLQPLSIDGAGTQPTAANMIYVNGGVLALYPFLFFYDYGEYVPPVGDNPGYASTLVGSLAYSTENLEPQQGTIIEQVVKVATSNIVAGKAIRGGSNAPSALFWSLSSVVRAYYTGDEGNLFSFDSIAENVSIISSNSIVELNGMFYWIGVDCFYVYNGTVQVVPNNMNIDYFFKNVDMSSRQKIWGTNIAQKNEVIWHWCDISIGDYTGENNSIITFNVVENTFFISQFPVTEFDKAGQTHPEHFLTGRSCGTNASNFPYPIWLDNAPTQFTPGGINPPPDGNKYCRIWTHENTDNQVIPLLNTPYLYAPLVYPIRSYIQSPYFSYGAFSMARQWVGDSAWTNLLRVENDFQHNGDIVTNIITKRSPTDTALLNSANIGLPYYLRGQDTCRVCAPQNIFADDANLSFNGNLYLGQPSPVNPLPFHLPQLVTITIYNSIPTTNITFTITGKFNGKDISETLKYEFDVPFKKPLTLITLKAFDIVTLVSHADTVFNPVIVSVGTVPPFAFANDNTIPPIDRLKNFYFDCSESGRLMSFQFIQEGIGSYFRMGQPLFTILPGPSN